jgi:hypothetical protein
MYYFFRVRKAWLQNYVRMHSHRTICITVVGTCDVASCNHSSDAMELLLRSRRLDENGLAGLRQPSSSAFESVAQHRGI